jgi:hypothetical protein
MMTEFDREYVKEMREEHYRELRETLDREHRQGLNNNPYYGWTQQEIDNYEASFEVDKEPRQTEDEE